MRSLSRINLNYDVMHGRHTPRPIAASEPVPIAVAVALMASIALGITACTLFPTGSDELPPGYETIESRTLERRYMLSIPSSLPPDEPAPLLLAFHGGGGTARDMRDRYDLDVVAMQHGFIVAYLEAWERAARLWAIGGNTEADIQGVDDVRFTTDLIDRLTSTLNIDQTRIFAVGISNGGQMVHRLGCTVGDRISGIGSVAATIRPDIAEQCASANGVAGVFVHGTADEVFWWDGIPGGELSASGTVQLWAELNGCSMEPDTVQLPDTTDQGLAIERTLYTNCDLDNEVAFYGIIGGRHAWPSIASEAIVEFFANGGITN